MHVLQPLQGETVRVAVLTLELHQLFYVGVARLLTTLDVRPLVDLKLRFQNVRAKLELLLFDDIKAICFEDVLSCCIGSRFVVEHRCSAFVVNSSNSHRVSVAKSHLGIYFLFSFILLAEANDVFLRNYLLAWLLLR